MEFINCPTCHAQLVCPPDATVLTCGVCHNPLSVARRANGNPHGRTGPAPPYAGGTAAAPPPAHPGWAAAPPPGGMPAVPPAGGGARRALLIGINYHGTRSELGGCINDARCMAFLLKKRFNFKDDGILILSEDNPNPVMHPTRHNIINGMRWLMGTPRPGDSLFFHFSGHGGQTRAKHGDERDGLNETLLPLDFKRAGVIEDDEINHLLVNPLPHGCRLTAVVDACHSGSVFDLPYTLDRINDGRANWIDESRYSPVYKGTAGGEVVCFSACEDSKTSADTTALSKVTSTGAMTFCFIAAVESSHAATYRSIMEYTVWRLKNALDAGGHGNGPLAFVGGGGGGGLAGNVLGMLLGGGPFRPAAAGLTQVPQLSANQPFDINRPFSI